MSLHKTHICVVKSLVKIAAVSWHSLRRFIKPAPGKRHVILVCGVSIIPQCCILVDFIEYISAGMRLVCVATR